MMLAALLALAGAQAAERTPPPTGRAWQAAESLFQRDPRWLGADASLSVELAPGRTLWLFGDSFVAPARSPLRRKARMVRNTIAVQTGSDPTRARISMHWRTDADGAPASFFPERGKNWYWPGHGIRLQDGPLLIFLYELKATPGQGLGFAHAGHALAILDQPDSAPESWRPRIVSLAPDSFDAVPATAVVRQGDHIVALAIRQQGRHAGALVRYPVAAFARGDLAGAQWWAGDKRGWLAASELGDEGPHFVLDDAGAECSLHWDDRLAAYVHVASYGFGDSVIGMRTAPALTGPWTAPVIVYRPPESDAPQPFVYAAKAHPQLRGHDARDLVISYAANSFDFSALLTEPGSRSLYWPRLVRVRLPR